MDGQMSQDASIQVRMFGRFQISVSGEEVRLPTKKCESLFALLALSGSRAVPRAKLLAAIWPDWEEDRARSNLNTALWRIRKTLRSVHAIKVTATKDEVTLSLDQNVVIDIIAVRKRVEAARSAQPDERVMLLEAALSGHGGEFLEGLEEEWCIEERRECHRLHVETLRMLIEAVTSAEFTPQIRSCLEEIIALEPLDEEAHRDLIRGYYSTGDRARALQHYERLRELLKRELGVEPSPETRTLWEQIREQPQLRNRVREGQRLSSTVLGVGCAADLPLIGRLEPLESLVDAMTRAGQGAGSVFLVTGDVGIGKTRLAEAIATEGRIRGFEVLVGTCSEPDSGPPFQAIIQALWPRISRNESASSWSSPVVDQLVRTLMPEASSFAVAALSPHSPDSALINECLLSLLFDATGSSRSLLVLENVHSVERATENLLRTLVTRVLRERLLVILTMRSHEPQTERLVQCFRQLGAREIELTPLTDTDLGHLVKHALATTMVSDGLVRHVADRSSGVPLVALELLKFLVSESCLRKDRHGKLVPDEDAIRLKVPRTLAGATDVIRNRIRLVESGPRAILSAAAVLGREVNYDLLEEFMGVPEDHFIENVEHLVEARLIQETERGLRFPHEATRLASLSLLSSARLRKLHARAAELLERRAPSKSEDIALHWEQAGEIGKALKYYELSGDKARAVYANEDAFHWYSRSLETMARTQAAGGDGEFLRRKATLLIKHQEVLDLIGRRLEQSEDVEEVLRIAGRLKDQQLTAQGELLRSQVLCRLNITARAVASAQLATALFGSSRDTLGQARSHESLGVAFMAARDQLNAGRAFRMSLQLHRRAGERSGEARCLINLGTVACLDGRVLLGMEHLDEAERILTEIRDRRSLASALLQKGILYRCLGLNQQSERYLRSGIGTMEEIGDRIGQARGRSQMAFTHIALGELRDGLREALVALRIARQAKDVRAQIVFLNNVAYGAYRVLGDFDRAARAVSDAIRLATDGPGAENIATYYDTMAAVLLDQREYDEALRWAQQAQVLFRTWEQRFNYVGLGITYRLGLAHMYRGDYGKARPLLMKALDHWRRGGDLELQAQGVAALGLLYLQQGERDRALECAREIERLMRKVDGVEQVQAVYWGQYGIYRELGMDAAARRALGRAGSAVAHQSAGLKGRFRRLFTSMPANQEIMGEARRLGIVPNTELASLQIHGSCTDVDGLTSAGAHLGKATPAADRRRKLVMLMAGGANNEAQLATRLGVSPRTIRQDLSILRSQGFTRELLPRQVKGR